MSLEISKIEFKNKDDDSVFLTIEAPIPKAPSKEFHEGDIVYWGQNEWSGHYSVQVGRVRESVPYCDSVIIDFLSRRDRRLINGVPIEEWDNWEQRYKKLPKGWTSATKLFEVTMRDYLPGEEEFLLDLRNPESVKEAYEKNYLVKSSEMFGKTINTKITRDGFKILVDYMGSWLCNYLPTTTIKVESSDLFFTYEEAREWVEREKAEIIRQAELSEHEWYVERVDRLLNAWGKIFSVSDEEVQRCKNFLLERENVEDIDVRICGDTLEWQCGENGEWVSI